jgi:GTP:adenosylcobinamide-phosphate guanylyltransferase
MLASAGSLRECRFVPFRFFGTCSLHADRFLRLCRKAIEAGDGRADGSLSASSTMRAIVLAGQRPGTVNPLAMRFGVANKCLVPMQGRSLIEHVLTTLGRHPRIGEIHVSTDEASAPEIAEAAGRAGGNVKVRLVEARASLAESVAAAAEGTTGSLLVTTGDHVLLASAAIDAVAVTLARAEAVVAMTRRDAVLAAHALGQLRLYAFSDGAYADCRLYGANGPGGLKTLALLNDGGRQLRDPSQIGSLLGMSDRLKLKVNGLSLEAVVQKIGRKIGVDALPVVLADGSQAFAIENDLTYGISEQLLAQRPK